MSQSTIDVCMDETLKEKFDAVCSMLGLSMSTALTIFEKKMIQEKRLKNSRPWPTTHYSSFADTSHGRVFLFYK